MNWIAPNGVAPRNPSAAKAEAPKPGKKITAEEYAQAPTEHAQQVAVFIWASEPETLAAMPEIKWLHAIPNGGERNEIVAGRMKAEGVKSGVLDLCWPLRRRDPNWSALPYSGLYLEMKRPASVGSDGKKKKAGVITPEQNEFAEYAISQGFYCQCAWTYEQAKQIIIQYYNYGA